MTSPSERAPESRSRPVPTAAIVALVGKGMSAREIMAVFPELRPEDVRAALLEAAEVVRDADASLRSGDAVGEIIREAQQNAGLSDDEAMELAVNETRAVRKERARRSK